MRTVLFTLALVLAAPAVSAQSVTDADAGVVAADAPDPAPALVEAQEVAQLPTLSVDLSDYAEASQGVLPPATLDELASPGDDGDPLAYWGSVAATGAGLLFFAYLTFM